MKALNARQKRLLLGLLAVVLLIVALLLVPLFAPKKEKAPESIVAVIPEADLVEDDGSKTSSYRNGSIGSYWDSLDEQDDGAQPGAIPSDTPPAADARKDSRKPAAVVVDDIFGDYKDTPVPVSEPAPRRSQGSGSSSQRTSGAKPQEASAATSASTPEESAAAPAPEAPRPQVKRSGAVSSLDEDVATDLGNGFSTLDGKDHAYTLNIKTDKATGGVITYTPTGGTAKAAIKLIEKLGGKVECCAFVIELFDLKGREVLDGYRIETLTKFPGH